MVGEEVDASDDVESAHASAGSNFLMVVCEAVSAGQAATHACNIGIVAINVATGHTMAGIQGLTEPSCQCR